ncbi:MAG: cupin domain-containing protein [Candidatus Methanoperedens sp.]|nr:cupin domain-containing protein [Candidatus Methanoperedens sp.]
MINGDPMAEPIILKDYIQYSPQSVVSKTLKQNPAGTITLFAFDAGQGLSEHSAPFDAVVQVIEGDGVFTVGGKEYNLKAGQFIIMPANVPHAVKASGKFKMLLTMLRA